MLKRIFLFFVIILFIFSFNLFSDDDECAPCPPGPGNPGNDNADETLSFSDENGNRFYFITPDVLIYKRGYYEVYKNPKYGEKENALTDLNNSGETLLKSGRILIIPSGGLFGKENDTTLKLALEQYVSLGGTLVVFAQQYGSHIENVVPGGESIKVYGWREDQRVSS